MWHAPNGGLLGCAEKNPCVAKLLKECFELPPAPSTLPSPASSSIFAMSICTLSSALPIGSDVAMSFCHSDTGFSCRFLQHWCCCRLPPQAPCGLLAKQPYRSTTTCRPDGLEARSQSQGLQQQTCHKDGELCQVLAAVVCGSLTAGLSLAPRFFSHLRLAYLRQTFPRRTKLHSDQEHTAWCPAKWLQWCQGAARPEESGPCYHVT